MTKVITGIVIDWNWELGMGKPEFLMGWEWGRGTVFQITFIPWKFHPCRREALSPTPHPATPFSYSIPLSCHY